MRALTALLLAAGLATGLAAPAAALATDREGTLAATNQLLDGSGLSFGQQCGEAGCALALRVDGAALWADAEVAIQQGLQPLAGKAIKFGSGGLAQLGLALNQSPWGPLVTPGQFLALGRLLEDDGIAVALSEKGALRMEVWTSLTVTLVGFTKDSPVFQFKGPHGEILASSETYKHKGGIIVFEITWSDATGHFRVGTGEPPADEPVAVDPASGAGRQARLDTANKLLVGTGLSIDEKCGKFESAFLAGETNCLVRLNVDVDALSGEVELALPKHPPAWFGFAPHASPTSGEDGGTEGLAEGLEASPWGAHFAPGQIVALNALLAHEGLSIFISDMGALTLEPVASLVVALRNDTVKQFHFRAQSEDGELLSSSEKVSGNAELVVAYDHESEAWDDFHVDLDTEDLGNLFGDGVG